LYGTLRSARDALIEWGEGAPFDNPRELQITRYYRKPPDIFSKGAELKEGYAGVCEKAWLRYAEFEIEGSEEE
jgi:hypothetical protein